VVRDFGTRYCRRITLISRSKRRRSLLEHPQRRLMYGIAVYICMHTVIETPAFLASAADERIEEGEREAIISYMAANPDARDVMPGTGGARKVRFAGRGKGKSGGYRVITFYAGRRYPGIFARRLWQGRTSQFVEGATQ
jgi:hypothetical protein